MDAPILKALGQVNNAMLELSLEIYRTYGLKAHPVTAAVAGRGAFQDHAMFEVAVNATNDAGYDLSWFIEISEERARYAVDRGLYGHGRSEAYRGGAHLLFELPQVSFTSQAELCEALPRLVQELRGSLKASLAVVPND